MNFFSLQIDSNLPHKKCHLFLSNIFYINSIDISFENIEYMKNISSQKQFLFDFDLICKDYYYSILFKFKRLFFILFVKISLHRS